MRLSSYWRNIMSTNSTSRQPSLDPPKAFRRIVHRNLPPADGGYYIHMDYWLENMAALFSGLCSKKKVTTKHGIIAFEVRPPMRAIVCSVYPVLDEKTVKKAMEWIFLRLLAIKGGTGKATKRCRIQDIGNFVYPRILLKRAPT